MQTQAKKGDWWKAILYIGIGIAAIAFGISRIV